MFSAKWVSAILCGLLIHSSAFAETTRGGDGQPVETTSAFSNLGNCTRWFLFFCIERDDSGDGDNGANERTPRYNTSSSGAIEPAMTQHLGNKGAPIMAPFLKAFNQCAPGCSYTDWGVWGDVPHQKRRSCHNSGSAIDIHAITCNGRTHRGGTGDRRFNQFRNCMQGRNGLHTIYGSGKHKRHIDIALRSCQIGGVGKIQTRR